MCYLAHHKSQSWGDGPSILVQPPLEEIGNMLYFVRGDSCIRTAGDCAAMRADASCGAGQVPRHDTRR